MGERTVDGNVVHLHQERAPIRVHRDRSASDVAARYLAAFGAETGAVVDKIEIGGAIHVTVDASSWRLLLELCPADGGGCDVGVFSYGAPPAVAASIARHA